MDTRGIYTDYNRWLVTGFKVFRLLILLVAFILLLLAALSTPVIKSMSLFNVDLKADVNAVIVQLDEDVRIDVGVWGELFGREFASVFPSARLPLTLFCRFLHYSYRKRTPQPVVCDLRQRARSWCVFSHRSM